MRGIVIFGSSLMLVGAAAPTLQQVGAAPTPQQAISASEQAIRATLIDPQSAQFEWPYGFAAGSLKPMIGARKFGYWTCGRVNSKNRLGGYSGAAWFVVMLHDGVVNDLEVGSSDGDGATPTCLGALKQGKLVPAVSSPVSAPPPGPLGLQFRPTPYGAMIATVASGSIAEKAGLKPGEVIESVNGIPIKGMAPADMIKVVAAPTASTFGIIGSGEVRVRP